MLPNNTNAPRKRGECENQNVTSHAHRSNFAGESQESLWVPVSKTAKCNRCGRENLAWQQSRSGKWYLCVTRRTQDGKLVSDRRGFHKCQLKFTNPHGVEVTDADIPF
jgi:hypothetical protein